LSQMSKFYYLNLKEQTDHFP